HLGDFGGRAPGDCGIGATLPRMGDTGTRRPGGSGWYGRRGATGTLIVWPYGDSGSDPPPPRRGPSTEVCGVSAPARTPRPPHHRPRYGHRRWGLRLAGGVACLVL